MKKLLALLLVLTVMFSMAACNSGSTAPSEEPAPSEKSPVENNSGIQREDVPSVIRWGSASSGSAGYIIITAFSDTISSYVTDFKSSSMSTSGGTENMHLLADKEIDFAQTTSSDLIKASEGIAPFDQKDINIYQAVGYRTNANIIHVLKGSGIDSVDDLNGKKVAVGPASGAVRQMAEDGFVGLKVSPEFVYGSWDECAEMLKSNQVVAVVFPIVGGFNMTSAVLQLTTTADVTALTLTEEEAAAMVSTASGVGVVDVPAGYMGTDLPAFYAQGYHNAVGVRPEVSEEVVYTVVKTLLEHEEELQKVSNNLQLFGKDNALKYMMPSIPVHPGAVKYYKEIGIWDDSYTIGD